MRRIIVLFGLLALSIGVMPATAAQAGQARRVHGEIFTTAVISPDPTAPVHILTAPDAVSTFSRMGRVTLNQKQLVYPVTFQTSESGPAITVPATGTIDLLKGTLTAVNGKGKLFLRSPVDKTGKRVLIPFTTDPTVTAPNGLHPIMFTGDLRITGGTGKFHHARGLLHFAGGYCFFANRGVIDFDGTLTLKH